MNQTPILMRGPLARATLAGNKTVTRRTDLRWLKAAPGDLLYVKETWAVTSAFDRTRPSEIPTAWNDRIPVHYIADGPKPEWAGKTRVSLFMQPRFARLWLEVVSVREECVQDIAEEDARREGVEASWCQESWAVLRTDGSSYDCFVEPEPSDDIKAWVHVPPAVLSTAVEVFRRLWDSINGAKPGLAWADNPRVVRIEFKRAERPALTEAA